MSVEIIIANADSHASLFLSIVTERDATHDAFFSERTVMVVHEKQARRGITSDIDIRPTIFVQICGNHGHAIVLSELRHARFLADVREGAVTIVSIEGMSACRKASRAALDRNSPEIAIRTSAWNWRMLKRETHIIRNKQIEMAIPVVIEESATSAPTRLVIQEAGRFGDLGKRAVTVVLEEHVLSEVRAKNIVEAIVVVIRDANAVGPANGVQSGLLGHIAKCAVTIVLIQAVCGARRSTLQASTRK